MFGGDSVIVGATAAEIAKEPATGDPQTSKNYGRIGGGLGEHIRNNGAVVLISFFFPLGARVRVFLSHFRSRPLLSVLKSHSNERLVWFGGVSSSQHAVY